MTKEEKQKPLTAEQKRLTRKELLRLGLLGGGGLVAAAALSKLPKADASSLVTRGIQFTGGAVVASDDRHRAMRRLHQFSCSRTKSSVRAIAGSGVSDA